MLPPPGYEMLDGEITVEGGITHTYYCLAMSCYAIALIYRGYAAIWLPPLVTPMAGYGEKTLIESVEGIRLATRHIGGYAIERRQMSLPPLQLARHYITLLRHTITTFDTLLNS